jgi:DegV family protein with EDD domain
MFVNKYILSCCSTFDLAKEHFEEKNIHYVCFHYSLNGKQYPDDLGQTMPFDEFYETLRDKNVDVKTSQVNSDEFIRYFTPFLENGDDILHLCLSSGISGVYNSALMAKNELEKKFPDRKIYIVDSLGASSGGGLLMDKLAELKSGGMNIDELREWTEENKLRVNHWFFSTDLTFYIRGGRISKTAGLIGTILKICPILNMNAEGKLVPILKVRTKEKAIDEMLIKMEQNADNALDYSDKCYISQSACYEDAKKLADKIEEKFKHLKGKVLINNIGTTVGSHTGRGTIALFFWGNKRTD